MIRGLIGLNSKPDINPDILKHGVQKKLKKQVSCLFYKLPQRITYYTEGAFLLEGAGVNTLPSPIPASLNVELGGGGGGNFNLFCFLKCSNF